MRRYFVFVLLTLCFAVEMRAQPTQTVSVIHDTYKIASQTLGEERTILVRVPPNYGRSQARYPVIYMLDAHSPQNAMMVGMVEQQAWGGQMPEMIIVGIQNTNRTRDLTPSKTERGGSGGGDKFLDLLEKEVIPLVEKNYRTERFRIFAGHSLGGLTAIYAFSSRPDMFDAYIAASPVLHWDKDFVIKRSEEAFKQRKQWKKTVYIGLGNEPDYVKGYNTYKDLLKKADPDGLVYEFQQFTAENHGSVVLPAYLAGLRKVFAGWQPPTSGTFADLENHYKKLTERFGYTILVPENLVNETGYQLLRSNRVEEAIAVFKRNTALYPTSANCYDSLAEAYETSGQLKSAKENYEKALSLATSSGNQQLADLLKKSIDRVTAKMN